MELKGGMYVRTHNGTIFKIVDGNVDMWYIDITYNQLSRLEDYDYMTYSYNKNNSLFCNLAKKTSFNIIDLIEVGDFVNENEVIDKYLFNGEIPVLETTGDETNAKCMCEGDIKTILTHEQYERNCYKIN